MANKTIFELPLQTGITDNDVLAIVDSGNTTTSKITVATLLSGAGGGGAFQQGDASQSIVPYYSPTSRGVSADTTYVDKLNLEGEVFTSNANETFNLVQSNTTVTNHPYNRAFAGHSNSKISSTNTSGSNMLIGTLQGVISSGSYGIVVGMGEQAAGGFGNTVVGSQFTSKIQGSGNYNFVNGGAYNTITSGSQSALLGGTSNNISNDNSVIAGGFGNTITRQQSFIGGGQSNTINAPWATVIAGSSNRALNGSQWSGILGGRNNDLNEALESSIIGSYDSSVNLTYNGQIIGGSSSNIYHDQRAGNLGTGIYSSASCNIRQTAGSGTGAFKGSNAAIFNSTSSDIAGQIGNETTLGTIIGSTGTRIGGGTTNTVMIGTSGRTGANSYTTYVETLEAFTHVVLNNYASLNFASDSAAATGGVPLGGLYHTSGALKVRIT